MNYCPVSTYVFVQQTHRVTLNDIRGFIGRAKCELSISHISELSFRPNKDKTKLSYSFRLIHHGTHAPQYITQMDILSSSVPQFDSLSSVSQTGDTSFSLGVNASR